MVQPEIYPDNDLYVDIKYKGESALLLIKNFGEDYL